MFVLLLQMSRAAALKNIASKLAGRLDAGLRDEASQPVTCTSGPPGRDLTTACDATTQAACEASYVREDSELMAQTILWECSWDHTDSGTGAVTPGCSQLGNGHTFATVECPAATTTAVPPSETSTTGGTTYYRGPNGAIDNHLDITGAGGLPGEGAVERTSCINTTSMGSWTEVAGVRGVCRFGSVDSAATPGETQHTEPTLAACKLRCLNDPACLSIEYRSLTSGGAHADGHCEIHHQTADMTVENAESECHTLTRGARTALVDGNSCFAAATTETACEALYEEKYRGDHRVPGSTVSYNLIGETHLCQWNRWQNQCEAGEVVTICPEEPYPVQVKLDTDSNDLNVKWCEVARADRVQCDGAFLGITEQQCVDLKCCWSPLEAGSAEPWCFNGAAAPAAGSFHEREEGLAQLTLPQPSIKEFDLAFDEPGQDSGGEPQGKIMAEPLDLA